MTATTADPGLLAEIKRFGAADISACFSCGVCTATCPLSENAGMFPRRVIRLAQVGMRDALLSSKELWTCYYCGECSDSCPTQADPASFMAAARRWAIARYDRTRLGWTLATRPVVGTTVAILLALLFAVFMYASHGAMDPVRLRLFEFIPEGLIHNVGVGVMVLVFLAGLGGVITMARRVARSEQVTLRDIVGGRAALSRTGHALWYALGLESLGQRRFRRESLRVQESRAWYRRRWFLHAMTMWGFLGLLAATLIDYGLSLLGVRPTGTQVALWDPVRLLGTLSGAALLYGTTMFLLDRYRRADRSALESRASDWTLLGLLWLTGASGFVIELALYLPQPPAWGYWVFLFHVALAMELVLLAPFMKFAHAVYRPVALFFLGLKVGTTGSAGTQR